MADATIENEQKLLDKFKAITEPTIKSRYFTGILQSLKGALYNKNYLEAFGNEDYLRAYLARYVPSRGIVYYRMMKLYSNLLGLSNNQTIISIGGGAGSELAGLSVAAEELKLSRLNLKLLDIGNWDKIIEDLNTQFVGLNVTVDQKDVLNDDSINYSNASIITILFTISELFIQSKAKSLQFLNKLTNDCQPGTKLLIAESVGLSLVPVGQSGKTYPITMILDHTLKSNWRVLESQDAQWFRLSPDVQYPLKLENCRCIIRIYERI